MDIGSFYKKTIASLYALQKRQIYGGTRYVERRQLLEGHSSVGWQPYTLGKASPHLFVVFSFGGGAHVWLYVNNSTGEHHVNIVPTLRLRPPDPLCLREEVCTPCEPPPTPSFSATLPGAYLGTMQEVPQRPVHRPR